MRARSRPAGIDCPGVGADDERTGPPGAGELLHAATVAIAGQVTLGQLWHAVPACPTLSEVWPRLLEAERGA